MLTVREIISILFLLAGTCFCLTSIVGYYRLPDFYTRCHASGNSETMGLLLVGVGFIVQSGFSVLSVKIVVLFLIICACNPIGGHILDRTGRKSKFPMFLADKKEV